MLRQLWIDLRVRFSALFGRRNLKARAREEMEFHLEMREQRLIDFGVPADEARRLARREFGNRLLVQEAMAEAWRYAAVMKLMQDIWSDLRYAGRCLKRSPGFTAAAMLTIALGIGVNAGIFTVLNGILFRDLPAPAAHELLSIQQTVQGGEFTATLGVGSFSTAEYHAYRDGRQTLSGVLAHSNPMESTLGGDSPQRVFGLLVSCNYFDVLRRPPALGRALSPQDCGPDAAPVVVLGYELWTTAFAADSGILGRTVELNRHVFTVVGVAAEGMYGASPMHTGYFAPLSTDPLLGRNTTRYQDDRNLWLYLVARRHERAGIEQVRAELSVVSAQIDRQQPGRSTSLTIQRARPMTVPPFLRPAATGAAAVLMAAFGSILLIACANIANLLLARGTARSQEIAIRLSLGASRARIVRQLLAESLLISLSGGVLGSVVAVWSFQSIVSLALPALVPPEVWFSLSAWDLSPDSTVLSFAVALTLGAGLLFGLTPALHVSRPDLHAMIKQASGGSNAGFRSGRLRGMLVGVEVALCMTLMVAAGLLVRGLYSTYSTDPGFRYRDVAYVAYGLDGLPFQGEDAAVFMQRLQNAVQALPGVQAVAFASDPPLGEERAFVPVRLPAQSKNESRSAEINAVTAEYFELLEIPITRGRTFTVTEIAGRATDAAVRPVIVSETTARNFWGDGDPIGRTLLQQSGMQGAERDITLNVVGVAADAQVTSLGSVDPYFIYLPGGEELLVRSRSDFAATAASIRAIIRSIDPTLVVRVLPLEANLGWWRGVSRLISTLGSALGALALVLAAVGIYGVVSYSVTRRYREIGIRMALGAERGRVLAMILRQTMRPVFVGALAGFAAGAALSRILPAVLFGVSPADPIGLGGGALVVLTVALVAGVMAVRPAIRRDPTAALRYD